MKRIFAKIKIVNYGDIELAARGITPKKGIRLAELEGRIDTGCTHLALPGEVAEELGLRKLERRRVKYAGGGSAWRWLGSVVQVEINGRRARVTPLIEKSKTEILIGNPILEEMDLLVDIKRGKLYPNPESPDGPLVELL